MLNERDRIISNNRFSVFARPGQKRPEEPRTRERNTRIPCGRPRHLRRARVRHLADAQDALGQPASWTRRRTGWRGILGTGEQTSPGTGDIIQKVGIGLCLKQSDASEPHKYEKYYTLKSRCPTFLKAEPDFRGVEASVAHWGLRGAGACLECLPPSPQTPLV